MFESTLSVASPDLMRVSAHLRLLNESDPLPAGASTHLAALPPSLANDLRRFDRDGIQTELIEVVAASMRHGRNLLIHLEYGTRVVPLNIYPAHRMMQCPLAQHRLLRLRLTELFVLSVEPARLQPPGDHGHGLSRRELSLFAPLGSLTWELALRGARSELLPEIPAHAAFRIPPGVALQGMDFTGSMAAAIHRLKRQSSNLKDISGWAGFDRERAMRLLNGLYLQSALMASRTHPAADSDVFT
jgi:hypothetical protein